MPDLKIENCITHNDIKINIITQNLDDDQIKTSIRIQVIYPSEQSFKNNKYLQKLNKLLHYYLMCTNHDNYFLNTPPLNMATFQYEGNCLVKAVIKALLDFTDKHSEFTITAENRKKLQKMTPQLNHSLAEASVSDSDLKYIRTIECVSSHPVEIVAYQGTHWVLKKEHTLKKITEIEAAITQLKWYVRGSKYTPKALPVIDKKGNRVGLITTYFANMKTLRQFLTDGRILTTEQLITGGYCSNRITDYIFRNNDAHSRNNGVVVNNDGSYTFTTFDNDRAGWGVPGIETNKFVGYKSNETCYYRSNIVKKQTCPAKTFQISAEELYILPHTYTSFPANWHDSEIKLWQFAEFKEAADGLVHNKALRINNYIDLVIQPILAKNAVKRVAQNYLPKPTTQQAFINWITSLHRTVCLKLFTIPEFYGVFFDNFETIHRTLHDACKNRNLEIPNATDRFSWHDVENNLFLTLHTCLEYKHSIEKKVKIPKLAQVPSHTIHFLSNHLSNPLYLSSSEPIADWVKAIFKRTGIMHPDQQPIKQKNTGAEAAHPGFFTQHQQSPDISNAQQQPKSMETLANQPEYLGNIKTTAI